MCLRNDFGGAFSSPAIGAVGLLVRVIRRGKTSIMEDKVSLSMGRVLFDSAVLSVLLGNNNKSLTHTLDR